MGTPKIRTDVAEQPALRRDIRIARSLGTSCKVVRGWRAKTFYHHNPDGSIAWTETESPWDPFQLALVDALSDWEADLHKCGRPMSESLRVIGRPDPTYVVGRKICVACQEVDREQKALNDMWKKAHEAGYHPEHYTELTVHTIAEAQRMIAEQQGFSPE